MQERTTGSRRQRTTMMRMLEQRVPLTLLLDLVAPPNAQELYRVEGGRDLPRRAPTERVVRA